VVEWPIVRHPHQWLGGPNSTHRALSIAMVKRRARSVCCPHESQSNQSGGQVPATFQDSAHMPQFENGDVPRILLIAQPMRTELNACRPAFVFSSRSLLHDACANRASCPDRPQARHSSVTRPWPSSQSAASVRRSETLTNLAQALSAPLPRRPNYFPHCFITTRRQSSRPPRDMSASHHSRGTVLATLITRPTPIRSSPGIIGDEPRRQGKACTHFGCY
jgi:hypothetical protein